MLVFFVWMSYAKIEVPVFLLSGQSNMTGYANGSALTADQKKTVDNVKIYMDLVWEGDAAKMKKWVTLGPGFGSNASNIGPELYLGRTLSDSMPGKKFALIKCCSGSTYLGKASDWLPPSSNNGVGGTLYNKMTGVIDAAFKTFTTAFDTAQYTPKWAGFVWLQGEFDAYDLTLSNAYQKNLTNLITDIRSQVKVADLPVIIPMIDAQGQWTNNVIVRAAEVAVTKSLKNVDTLDTKGYPTDGTHYTAPGQVKIGTVTAQRWMKMKYISVPIVGQYSFPSVAGAKTRAAPFSQSMFLDLSGRKISVANRPLSKNGILIRITTTTGNSQGYKKITVEN
ncbi:MAG TPA: sialate O-acetylesterase [Chitinivibrionales bacterium]